MKQPQDLYTRDAFEAPKRGRPRKPDALTPAERARRYRERKRRDKPSDARQEAAARLLDGLALRAVIYWAKRALELAPPPRSAADSIARSSLLKSIERLQARKADQLAR